jgi:hypothetical protein
MKTLLWPLLCLILCSFAAQATHLKGAELTAKPTSPGTLTYTFTLVLYEESGGVSTNVTSLNFGNGQYTSLAMQNEEVLSEGVRKKTYVATHTYAAAGVYRVSFTGSNRANSINIDDALTTEFHIELNLLINQLIGTNSTPVFRQNPQFRAIAGEVFTDDYSATDAEGDSLVYKLVSPPAVSGYVFPHKVGGDTENTFTIDARTGSITWDKPKYIGNYVIAVQIEEWRQGVKISVIYRDIQISVTGINTPANPSPVEERKFAVYPNPASGKVFINLPESSTHTVAEIWSIKGEFLLRKKVQSSGHADGIIDIGHLPAGIYVIKVVSVNGYFTRRLVIMQ